MKFFNRHIQNYIRLLGLLVFITIITRIHVQEIFISLSLTKWVHLIIAFLLLTTFHFLKAIRWRFLLLEKTIHRSFWDCYLTYMIGLFWGIITPGRMGDFIKAYYIKDAGYRFSDGVIVVIVDRILDLIIILLFTVLGLVLLFLEKNYLINLQWLALPLLSVLLLIILLILFKNGRIIEKVSHWIWFQKVRDEIIVLKSYIHQLLKIKPAIFLIIYSVIAWLVYLQVIYFLIRSFGLELTFIRTITCFFISTLISLIPISYAGIGTRDAALIFLFHIYGYRSEDAILFSFSILSVYFFTLIVGLISILLKGQRKLD